jgi:hypothetical protein
MHSAGNFGFVHEYMLDAWQRSILTLDVLRERGNIYHEHNKKNVPHVLQFQAELVRDGRTLPRPVNYLLGRILPPKGVKTDPAKPPFIIVDPRAGHGPGIGGMKADSEIGAALNAGHPCYYIGFLTEPVPGQTVEDVCAAEAAFIKEVAALHPGSETKPVIIANCQAGWQIMMTAAANPDLAGPILLAGSPLSYWAGVHGKNPMRYLGGLLAGSWMTALSGDMGNGLFDGAHLVANFESLEPANTYWEKPYNVYSKVDTEAARFLNFETWWGSPILMNAEEMQWIADNLFIGNKLSSGSLQMPDGQALDLRNIKSPIVVFCSWGDNITPPQQALGWVTDIYKNDREIVANGQTIVYTIHDSIGHLGIFVSGKIATKEHREFTECMDFINLAPPGLYEAVITEVDENTKGADLAGGKYLFRLEARTLDDIRALGANDSADDLRFATAARLSEINLNLYRSFVSPMVRAMTTEFSAEMLRTTHPSRQRFSMFSDKNPSMKPIKDLAKDIREARAPVSPDNPLLAMEKIMSSWISLSLDNYRAVRDTMSEAVFMNTYGSPLLQSALKMTSPQAAQRGLDKGGAECLRPEMEGRFEAGGLIEAKARALIYVNRPDGAFDERGFAMIKKIREALPAESRRSINELKELLKEQALLVRLDEKRAIEAIPKLLPKGQQQRQAALKTLHKVLEARGTLSGESQKRLAHIDFLFTQKTPPHANQEVNNGPSKITQRRSRS